MDFHPPFLTERQIPKHVSKIIDKIAIITKGLTGAKIVQMENANKVKLVFIFALLFYLV
jgi:hypothetical protein